MNQRNVVFTLCLSLAILVIFISRMRQEPRIKESFNRHPRHLAYSKHALCRMDCRHISKSDIMEIMEEGVINLNKSNKYDSPCPSFALQGVTDDGESLRVFFAQCSNETKVITCYNLKKDFECHCPGDDK